MKQDDWSKRLRNHLADYEAPVPDDLWERIEARLPKELVAEKPKARTIPLWVRWTAAAALVGVIVGTTALLWPSQEETTAPMASATKVEGKTPMKSEKTAETESVSPAIMSPVITKTAQPFIAEAVDKSLPDTASQYIKEVESEVVEAQPQQPSIEPTPTGEQPKMEQTQQQIRDLDQKIAEYKSHRSHHTTVSLYASNGFGDLSNRNGVLMSEQMLANYDYDSRMGVASTRSGSPVYLVNYEERQKYHQPISFGLTANIPISSALSVSSGVVYTRLSSDFTNIANSIVYEKKMTLHYIGIPLNVQYRVWQWRGLNVYATAGGQADFNVKVRLEADGLEQEMEKDRVQWSVGGALGVQYNIIPQLGLYAEPGIKYYFDNGSHIRNYFKYRPTNFNLQIGLRLNMGKP